MKRYGSVLAVVIALLSGVAAVWLANRWMANRATPEAVTVRETMPTTQVAIAARDLQVGARLTAEALTLAEWPAATAPKGVFSAIEPLEGRVVVTRLRRGQPIIAAELAAPGSGAGLVATIAAGKRAMAIRVDEVVGVGGFVLPNTYVDVIAVQGDGDDKKARTLLERIQVLAVAQETFTEAGKPQIVKTVTLELEPKQAEKLALQTHEGPIHLILRNPAEEVAAAPPPPEPPPVVARKAVPLLESRVRVPKPTAHTVEIIRGTKAETIEFRHAGSEERIN